MSKCSAFLFDLDGVLVDSMQLHIDAWVLYLKFHGISDDSLSERMHGKRNDDIVREIFGDSLSAEDVFRHGAAKEALFREMMGPDLEQKLVPGIRSFLERWKDMPMGLGSNAEPANVDFVLGGARLRPYFQAIVDGHQVERPKPDPDVYLRAASQMGVDPASCIVFEDSITGVNAGLRAGAKVVGIATTSEELPGVQLMVRDFTDPALESWLKSIAILPVLPAATVNVIV